MAGIERTNASTQPIAPRQSKPLGPEPIDPEIEGFKAAEAKGYETDGLRLSHKKAGEHGEEGGYEAWMESVAHTAHQPHGWMHAVEAGEHAVVGASRAFRAGRAAVVASEVAEAASEGIQHAKHAHKGLLEKGEELVGHGLSKAGKGVAQAIEKLPGGKAVVKGVSTAAGAPGRAAASGAKALDGALEGTALAAKGLKFTGAAGRFVETVGGRLPIVGALLGGVIAAVDVKSAAHTFHDPHASTKDKAIAGTQAGFSVASGLLGVGALGVAGAAAIGLTAPVSVPLLMTAAAITGAVSFGLSFFRHH
jgi:hypothetical protein